MKQQSAPKKVELVPEGSYQFSYVGYETYLMYGRTPKVALTLRIVTHGEVFGILLPKYYNAERLTSEPKRSGGFSVAPRSNFLFDYYTLFPDADRVERRDRIPMSRFKGTMINASVRTVTTSTNQQNLPSQMYYSIIDKLLGVVQT